ncbi:MAG: hypothetical protein PHX51_08520 [Clostridia bacterium]|nr:hypothetical protein [Clostridia bacterium]
MIVKNSRFEQIRLTWRMLMHSFLIYEDEVIQPEPILMSKESTVKTASLSGLLYLISAYDASKIDSIEDRKISEAKKNAVKAYISDEIDSLCKKKEKLEKQLNATDGCSINTKIQRVIDELSATEHRILEEINKSKGTLAQVLYERDRLAECNLLLDRYEKLRSQYATDIKRLAFIVEGEVNMEKLHLLNKCPFCDGDLLTEMDESYTESANGELKRISELLTELGAVEQTVITDKNHCLDRISVLNSERDETERFIRTELRPRAEKLTITLSDYHTLVRLQKELEIVNELHKEKTEDYGRILAAHENKANEYKPREHFPIGFEADMTRMFNEVLRECRYENLLSAMFSLKDFDVIVNSKHKADFGKGYKAFLNVTLAITMREYLCKYGKYAPCLLIVDSPLLSLEQGVSDSAPDSMKSGLIEYLMRTQDIGQTIIIENRIPKLDYEKYNVKLNNFTKGKTRGRYGLLSDVFI